MVLGGHSCSGTQDVTMSFHLLNYSFINSKVTYKGGRMQKGTELTCGYNNGSQSVGFELTTFWLLAKDPKHWHSEKGANDGSEKVLGF